MTGRRKGGRKDPPGRCRALVFPLSLPFGRLSRMLDHITLLSVWFCFSALQSICCRCCHTTMNIPSKEHKQWALCTIRSHGTKLYILVSKLRSGTSKTKAGPGELVRVALFWKSHCATCSPVYIILYHVTGSCKGPIPGTNSYSCFSSYY